MDYLMILSIKLLSMPMILLSNISVIRPPNLNLIYDTAHWWDKKKNECLRA